MSDILALASVVSYFNLHAMKKGWRLPLPECMPCRLFWITFVFVTVFSCLFGFDAYNYFVKLFAVAGVSVIFNRFYTA